MRYIKKIGVLQIVAMVLMMAAMTTAAILAEPSCSDHGHSQTWGYVNAMTANSNNAWFGYNNPFYGNPGGGSVIVNWQALDAYSHVVASGQQTLTFTANQIGGEAYTGTIDPSISWSDIQIAFAGQFNSGGIAGC
jgi:hypothetical protein